MKVFWWFFCIEFALVCFSLFVDLAIRSFVHLFVGRWAREQAARSVFYCFFQ